MGEEELANPRVPDGSGKIVGVIDGEDDNAQFVIADISRDGTWIAIASGDAVGLTEFR